LQDERLPALVDPICGVYEASNRETAPEPSLN
jgi:hypothetical protein